MDHQGLRGHMAAFYFLQNEMHSTVVISVEPVVWIEGGDEVSNQVNKGQPTNKHCMLMLNVEEYPERYI